MHNNIKMSVSSSLHSLQDKIIIDLLTKVAEKFSLDKKAVIEMYSGNSATIPTTTSPVSTPKAAIETKAVDSSLQSLTRLELVNKCKEKGLKVSGTKVELIARLSDSGSAPVKAVASKSTSSVKSSQSKTPVVIQKIMENMSEKLIVRNSFGNYEHSETNLVMDPKTLIS